MDLRVHEEAIRCFQLAAKADPDCAMAYWGIAYATGPNYNKQWTEFTPPELEESLGTAAERMFSRSASTTGDHLDSELSRPS